VQPVAKQLVIHMSLGGESVVFVPLQRAFRDLRRPERLRVLEDLNDACTFARLQGTVVPIWMNLDNTLEFLAPFHLHARVLAVSAHRLRANLNRNVHVFDPAPETMAVLGGVTALQDNDPPLRPTTTRDDRDDGDDR
jgi:hypothetical protein